MAGAPDLPSFRRAIADCLDWDRCGELRASMVVVPSRAAAVQLRWTLEERLLAERSAFALPCVVTREGLYAELHRRLGGAPPRLGAVERLVCGRAAAEEARASGEEPPFNLRPGLVDELLGLYDALRRNLRDVDAFERVLVETFEPSRDLDRGARRMLRQTRFLAAMFRAYERRVAASGRIDEHGVRASVLARGLRRPVRQVVLTVGDRASGRDGLWPGDFDLLVRRLRGLVRIDVVSTSSLLAAGYRERLEDLLPGIEETPVGSAPYRARLEVPVPGIEEAPAGSAPGGGARLVAPDAGRRFFTWRDREEELLAVVRRVKHRPPAERTAVVFQRPLPYLYAARHLFASAGVPYEAAGTLPLASEPFAAAVDLVLSFASSGCARRPAVELLRSPHFHFSDADGALDPSAVPALDRALREARYVGREGDEDEGGAGSPLRRLAGRWGGAGGRRAPAARAARVAAAVADELAPLTRPGPASTLVDCLLRFVDAHRPPPPDDAETASRESRARAGVVGILRDWRDAHVRHDDPVVDLAAVASTLRRLLEAATFAAPPASAAAADADAGPADAVAAAGAAAADGVTADADAVAADADGVTADTVAAAADGVTADVDAVAADADGVTADAVAAAGVAAADGVTADAAVVAAAADGVTADGVTAAADAAAAGAASGRGGVVLVDAEAARYGTFDNLYLVGLVDREWPDLARPSSLYPASLLYRLGWPREADRQRASRAAFRDLLGSAARRVTVSTVAYEDDAVVSGSPLLEDLADLDVEVGVEPAPAGRVTADAGLAEVPAAVPLAGEPAGWLALRERRHAGAAARVGGETGRRMPAAYAVSAVERYLHCPFQYFASAVLRLGDEPDDEVILSPRSRGRFVHDVLRAFFDRWQDEGGGAVDVETLPRARALAVAVAEEHLAGLPPRDRPVERIRLLGSPAGAGVVDRLLMLEADRPGRVRERLLEVRLDGVHRIDGPAGPRPVRLRGTADRIDLIEGGRLRVVDYKTGHAPDRSRALQLPIYGRCAEQALAGRHGREWRLAEAGYAAFGEPRTWVPLDRRQDIGAALAEGQRQFLATVDGIEDGRFPVRPAEPYRCAFCDYPTVCRKDYVGDE